MTPVVQVGTLTAQPFLPPKKASSSCHFPIISYFGISHLIPLIFLTFTTSHYLLYFERIHHIWISNYIFFFAHYKEERSLMDMASERKPYFFKVLIGNFESKLKLPPNFLKHLSNEASKQVSLVGPSGCSWSAELITYTDGTYISNGWSNFVEDHSLKEREFLVFRYDGSMNFSIQVFDTTACEREELFDIPPHRKLNMRNGSTEVIANVKLEVEDMEIDVTKSVYGNSVAFCSKSIERKLPVPVNTDASTSVKEEVYSRCPLPAKEIWQACEGAESFSSEFPTVIIQMTVSNLNKSRMRFPSWFSREHLPRKITNITLTDPNENPWDVVYCPGINTQRDRFSKGWTDVVRTNNIKEGDFCIFEVISHTDVRMHVFPVYKETPNVNV